MSTEVRPQPRFRMWDQVRYRGAINPINNTVIGIVWDEFLQDYEYRLASPGQSLDCSEDSYAHANDRDNHLYLVQRPGTESQPQKIDPLEMLTDIEHKQPDNRQLIKKLAEASRQLCRFEAELKHLQEENARKREAIRLFGTLCASRKEGE